MTDHPLKLVVNGCVFWLVEAHGKRHVLVLVLQVELLFLKDKCVFLIGLIKLVFSGLYIVFEPNGEVSFSIHTRWQMSPDCV